MLAKAALLKQSIEKARMAEHPTAAETRLREKGMDQFSLRCFNTLANHREISGVQGDTFIQHLARSPSDLATVTFNGQLTEYQMKEDSVAGGHSKTDAILLGLFIPWDKLPLLFLQHATQLNPYTRLWTAVEQTLPPHIQDFARNVELLWKFKEDCKLLTTLSIVILTNLTTRISIWRTKMELFTMMTSI